MATDITARKRAEDELRDSEERLRLALDTAQMGTYDWNPACDRVIWSQRTQEVFGFKPAEFAGRYEEFAGRVHPEDLPGVEAEIARSKTERNRYACEYGVVWPDGSIHWVSALGEFNYDAEGQAVHMRGTIEDITERKQTEAALRETEALRIASRYARNLLEASLDPFVTNSPDGKITDVNAATEAVTGYARDELIGTDFAGYFTEPATARAGYQHTFQTKSVRDYALEIRHRDGHLTPVLYNAAVYRNEAGNVAGVFAAARDMTEIKKAEQALRQSELQFRTLAEAMPQIVWMTRPDGWNIYFNQQWVDYTGLTLEESYGHGWNIPFHPDDRKRAWDAWQQATQTDGVYSLECRLRRADGIYRWWLVRGVSLHDEDGKVVNWFGTCTDIQDIKGYEEKLQLAANVFSHSREGILIPDVDGTIFEANQAFTYLTDVTRHPFRVSALMRQRTICHAPP